MLTVATEWYASGIEFSYNILQFGPLKIGQLDREYGF